MLRDGARWDLPHVRAEQALPGTLRYEKVKCESSLFRGFCVFGGFFNVFGGAKTNCLLSVDTDVSAGVGECFLFLSCGLKRKNRTLLLTAAGGIQEARREWAVELVGVGLR